MAGSRGRAGGPSTPLCAAGRGTACRAGQARHACATHVPGHVSPCAGPRVPVGASVAVPVCTAAPGALSWRVPTGLSRGYLPRGGDPATSSPRRGGASLAQRGGGGEVKSGGWGGAGAHGWSRLQSQLGAQGQQGKAGLPGWVGGQIWVPPQLRSYLGWWWGEFGPPLQRSPRVAAQGWGIKLQSPPSFLSLSWIPQAPPPHSVPGPPFLSLPRVPPQLPVLAPGPPGCPHPPLQGGRMIPQSPVSP